MKFYEAPIYSKEQLALLDESKVHFPFTDDDARYVGREHQYELTSKYFEERGHNLQVEIDGNSPDKVKHFLAFLRTKCYDYIYSHSKSPRGVLNYMIARGRLYGYSPYEYRQEFLEAMFLEGEYLLANGDLSTISGVDLDTMQNMSADVVRRQDRDMHPNTILKFKQLGLNYYGRYRFLLNGEDW